MQETHYKLPHITLSALVQGEAGLPPVLALHGWLDNAASFRALARHLPQVHLIAVDFAGHGFSQHRPKGVPYYLWDNVSDIMALADHLGLERFHLLGHSMGASVCSLIASLFPERVLSVSLIDGVAPLTDEPGDLPKLMALAMQQYQRVAQKRQVGYSRFEDAIEARMQGRFPLPDQVSAVALLKRALTMRDQRWYWHTDPRLRLASILRLSNAQVQSLLKHIQAPVLVCLAENGIATEVTYSLIKLVPNHRIDVKAGQHHFHMKNETAAQLACLINEHITTATR
ncbi:alpha/beta hydrolase [Nitrincola tibetensis]|uniref:Alpha/beta hydrolase n=1 Tax=Nitrincola tibetensis TaxID=2219697 RepID=A0A364NL17_9GAMM|nr:alpha/beta fold hydrolase [Nitrincola tibetensis]RAU17741.1 alpha/beta hydrolase [Nitrincola tibetensis]